MSKGQRKAFVLTTGQENIDPGNFAFRQRTLGLDWRKIAGIDADEIRETGNVELLQELIFTLTFCNVDAEFAHSSVADKNLLKIFKTSQLIIEYLIHCQECLLTTVNKNSQELVSLREEVEALREKLTAEKEFSNKAKKECHKRRLLAAQYQAELLALKSGNAPREQFPCPDCPKIFLSQYYLKVHLSKRHNVEMPKQPIVQIHAELPQQPSFIQQPQPQLQHEPVIVTVKPASAPAVIEESRHKEEMEQLRSFFTREMTEMSEKMAEWQRLAEQMRNSQKEVLAAHEAAVVVKPASPTPAPVLEPSAPPEQMSPKKHSNFGAKLEDDVAEQEKRILGQLGSQLNEQFVSFAGQLDERVLQLSRGIADQLATDSRRHVDTLSEQISNLMVQLSKERDAKELAERQRDETIAAARHAAMAKQKQPKRSIFCSSIAESQSVPSLAVPVPYAPVPVVQVPVVMQQQQAPVPPQPPPAAEVPTPKKSETKQKKSFLEALSSKFRSPKKATSSPSLDQKQQASQQTPQVQPPQVQSATLPRQGQKTAESSRPDFYPSSAPALPKVTYQELPAKQSRQPDQSFLGALMEDSINKSTDSELTSRPSSSSPMHFNVQTSPTKKTEWESAEPIPVSKTEPGKLHVSTPNDTLQASMTLPTLSATGGNLASTGPGEGAGSMYLSAASGTQSASGLVMRPRSAETTDSVTATPTDLDMVVRRQMMIQLQEELSKRGISKGERGLSTERFAVLKAQLEEERKTREFSHPDFFSNTRMDILSIIDRTAHEQRAAGGSTYRSEVSKTETSFSSPKQRQTVVASNANRGPISSTNATPRADRSEILATESQWTSEEDGSSDLKAPIVVNQPQRQQNVTIPVVPANVAAASSTAVVVSSGASPPKNVPSLRKSEQPPAVMQFSNSPITRGGQHQQQANLVPQIRTDGAASLSGTTDDVSTMDVTSSIQDQPPAPGPRIGGTSTNDFDETDSDDVLIKKEMARYNIDFNSAPTNTSPLRKQGSFPSQTSQPPTFGRSGQGMGSRPESSLTGVSDDYDQDLGP